MTAGTALAQTPPPPASSSDNITGSTNAAVSANGNHASSVNGSGTINIVAPSALVKGANSFTESQAAARIASAGFSQVTDLHQDDQGIWRGKAMRDGKPVNVGFDYKGNLAAE